MAKNAISYKKATTTTLKVSGILNKKEKFIDVDGENFEINDLVNEFDDGEFVEFQVKIKDEEELALGQELE